jgi:hypothetical protein
MKSAYLRASHASSVHEGKTMYLIALRLGKVTFLVWLAYAAYSAIHL